VVLAGRVTDTVKQVANGLVLRTVPRDTLIDASGPWEFDRETLITALDTLGSGANPQTLLDIARLAHLRVYVVVPSP